MKNSMKWNRDLSLAYKIMSAPNTETPLSLSTLLHGDVCLHDGGCSGHPTLAAAITAFRDGENVPFSTIQVKVFRTIGVI